jgi:thioredoxin 1
MKSPFLFSFLVPVLFLFIAADHHKANTNSYPRHGSEPGYESVVSGGALEFTDANFQKKVLSADKLTLVDFWAEWCGPCRRMGPVIEELAKEYGSKVNVGKLNVDHNPNVCARYNITSIPTILFIKNGKVVDRVIGLNPKSKLEKKIKALM